MSMMEYKGYLGSVEYNANDHCLYGRLAHIRDLVNYEATTVQELEAAFQAAVDDYLETCEKQGHAPDKPYKGSFNVRVGTELHRAAVLMSDGSLNTFVTEAISEKVARESVG